MSSWYFDAAALVQRYRPYYRFHPEEMFYPCHPEDQLRCADLVRVADGKVLIPALRDGPGSAADQLLCTTLGLEQLRERGISLDAATIATLASGSTPSPHYLQRPSGASVLLCRNDAGMLPPYGFINSARFAPPNGTWFHQGAPNNPPNWLGGNTGQFAAGILNPPAGVLRGAWLEPTGSAWVQRHAVAGVDYVDVIYTCFLSWNGSISVLAGQGEHPNDVETVAVRLRADDLDRPVRYYFQQHGGYSWYPPEQVELKGERLVVYLARQSHECYPRPGRYMRLFGFADDVCAADGVTWDAPAEFMVRPQGLDANGIDVDALRCAINPSNPNAVILIPAGQPGTLWQYVNYSWLARRPDSVPLSDDDFVHQPFPLATTKWWPDEGPAGDTPPLSQKAALASAPGVPPNFFDPAAAYLGPNPLPHCGQSAAASTSIRRPQGGPARHFTATVADTVTGASLGGAIASQAPHGTFVNWRGGIGTYLLGSINQHLPGWVRLLPDPLSLGTIALGSVTLSDVTIAGLTRCICAPVTPTGPVTLALSLIAPNLEGGARIDIRGGPNGLAATIAIDSTAISGGLTMLTPVAIPAAAPATWYVPYVGPFPYSYATAPFAVTTVISNAQLSRIEIAAGSVRVDVGNAALDAIIDAAIALMKSSIEQRLSAEIVSAVNSMLVDLYAGTVRVG